MSYSPDTEPLCQRWNRGGHIVHCDVRPALISFGIFQAIEDLHAGKWEDLPPDMQSCRGMEVGATGQD